MTASVHKCCGMPRPLQIVYHTLFRQNITSHSLQETLEPATDTYICKYNYLSLREQQSPHI